MPGPALNDVVVLELASGVAGPYAGRLLADLGATVLKVEAPSGDPARAYWPQHNGESAFFVWLNAGKLGLTAEPGDPRIAEWAAHADIILDDRLGEAATLSTQHSALSTVSVSITPYGLDGPRAGWQTSELTEYATSGFGYIAGDPQREPISLPGHQVEFHAGLHGAVAALSALYHARETGEGQRIEMSRQEAVLNDHAWLTTIWTHQGVVQQRAGSAYARCADGYVYLFNLVPYPNLFILMERFDLLEDESLLVPTVWWARFDEVMAAFSEWAADKPKQEIYHAAQELRVAVSPVNDMRDVANNPQLVAREWFGSVAAGGALFQSPGFPYRLSGTPCVTPGPAPSLGQHNETVASPDFQWPNAVESEAPPTSHPKLETRSSQLFPGLRVIEVTANWAGPIAGRHLGDLGADVIKVELATKPATRTLVWVNGESTWPNHYNRAGYFNKLNRNKRAICLDLGKDAGRKAFLNLVAGADIVIENNAARVMGNLKLGYEDLRAVNPGIIMCSMAGFGATGPERNYSAYGSNIETSSGLASILGYGPGEFYNTGSFYADPVTGNHGLVAILAALHARRRTGEGQWIDVSLLEAVTPFFAQPLLDYTVTGEVLPPQGNRSRDFAPQGVYRTIGADNWLAITVRDEDDWRALCRVIGREELAADPRFATVEGRRAAHDFVDAELGAWASEHDHIRAAELLQSEGVPAAPVMPNWQLFTDNHLNGRGYYESITHPEAGTHAFPGFAWRFEKTPATISRPAPMFAEHNREVFGGLLGLDEAVIDGLYAEGITSDTPVYSGGTSL